jgi:hypothetical protein
MQFVIAGLVPVIHRTASSNFHQHIVSVAPWIAGTSPTMTGFEIFMICVYRV